MGGSYQDKVYLGATIGIPLINYYEYSEHAESINSEIDTISNLRQLKFTEEYSAYGTGYNLKIGGIYRISETTKIGASVHTPTFFSIEEDYYTSLTTFFKDSSLEYSMGYPAPFTYNLITPLKASVSASKIFNKNILISVEYELIDYSSAKYFTSDFENANKSIESIYQRTENLKAGGEINIKPFILRAGYVKYGSAFANKDFSRESFSYGIGINNGSYFMDIAYVLTQGKDKHLLYSEDYIDPISLKNTNHNFLFTLGFRY
jgi:long-subunit fatty acid transport protein